MWTNVLMEWTKLDAVFFHPTNLRSRYIINKVHFWCQCTNVFVLCRFLYQSTVLDTLCAIWRTNGIRCVGLARTITWLILFPTFASWLWATFLGNLLITFILKQPVLCVFLFKFSGIQFSKRMPNSKFYGGPYVGFTDVPSKPFMLVDSCQDLLHVQCPPPRCGRKAPSQSEVGRKVTTRSITPTTAAATTKTPFIDPKESVTNGILVNATAPSTKSPGLLQGMFQNLLGAFQLSSILLTFLVSFQIKNINTNFWQVKFP